MAFRNAVDAVAAGDRKMRHAHRFGAVFFDQRHAAQPVHVTGMAMHDIAQHALIDLIDDLKVARQQSFHHAHRPELQRLRQKRVVSEGTGLDGDVPGAVPIEPVDIHKKAHQFGYRQHRVGVIQLNGNFFRQQVERFILALESRQNVLDRRADKKIFLLQSQLASYVGRVARVKDLGDRLGFALLLDGVDIIAAVEIGEVEIGARRGRPQTDGGYVFAIQADNGKVVGPRHHIIGV